MKNQVHPQAAGRDKVISILALYTFSILIILAGAVFSVISVVDKVSIPVLSSQIPGVVFGAVVIFLGVRYLISVGKLKAEVYKADTKFSWSNFRRVR